jgi:hypothetical protein
MKVSLASSIILIELDNKKQLKQDNQPSFSANEFPSLQPARKEIPQPQSKKKGKKNKQPPAPVQQPPPQSPPQVPRQPQPQQGEFSMAARLKLQQLQEYFPTVPKEIVTQTFVSTNQNVEQAVQTITEVYGEIYGVAPGTATQHDSSQNGENRSGKKSLFTSVPKLWVETGESVAQLYEQYRTEAIEHALLRNKYFSIATASYLR